MRKFYLLLLFVALCPLSHAQAPQSFKYQAVVRNPAGQILVNQLVSVKVSLLLDDAFGTIVYSETHTKATNEFGLINMNIGEGTVVSGIFANIDWGAGTYFVKTEVDINGGSNYEFMGTTQLLSVPYALFAEKSANNINDNDADPDNELQDLSIAGHNLTISQGNTVTLPDNVDDADSDPANEIQNLSVNGHSLSISGANTITLPDNVDDADADPSNEIQALSISNDTLYLSNGGFVYLGYMLDNTDNQTLSMPDQYTIQISNGNSVTLSAGMADLDADPDNELQFLSLSNDTLYLSQGNYVVIPKSLDDDPLNEIQVLSRTGNNVTLSNGGGTVNIEDGDSDSTNELQMLSLSNDTIYISNGNSIVLTQPVVHGYIDLSNDTIFKVPFGIYTLKVSMWGGGGGGGYNCGGYAGGAGGKGSLLVAYVSVTPNEYFEFNVGLGGMFVVATSPCQWTYTYSENGGNSVLTRISNGQTIAFANGGTGGSSGTSLSPQNYNGSNGTTSVSPNSNGCFIIYSSNGGGTTLYNGIQYGLQGWSNTLPPYATSGGDGRIIVEW